MRVARRYVVSGQVQGVGFRMFTAAAARRDDLRGWVRNLPDGRVEVVCEGDAESVERLARMIRQGPPGARVDEVESDATSFTARETGFTIR
jgi:acylphosphatase